VQLIGIDSGNIKWLNLLWFENIRITYSPSRSVSRDRSFCCSNFFRILLSKPGFRKSSFKSRSKPSVYKICKSLTLITRKEIRNYPLKLSSSRSKYC